MGVVLDALVHKEHGVISAISYVNEKKQEGSTGAAAEYVVYVDFTPDETVRLGMTVVVYVQ